MNKIYASLGMRGDLCHGVDMAVRLEGVNMGFGANVGEAQAVTAVGWGLFFVVESLCIFLSVQFYLMARRWNEEAPTTWTLELLTNGKPREHFYALAAALLVLGFVAIGHQLRVYLQTL